MEKRTSVPFQKGPVPQNKKETAKLWIQHKSEEKETEKGAFG